MSERAQRALPWLLPLVVLLPDPWAALPRLSYYFRDFTVTFYPLRLFVARELREGRWPFWNPYLYEGTFVVPSFYPVDLLLALWPSPQFASWLLTLHLPLAALGAYALAREIGQERPGAFVAGAVYALGGLALSSLNLFVFLQALALAPIVAVLFRRAAARGGRAIAWAALLLAASLTTLAVEFVAQGLVLAWLLGLEQGRDARSVGRLALASGLGIALAAVPIGVVLGLLPETQRGVGFESGVAFANEVHPFALAQAVVPGIFGPLDAPPGEVFWGGRFFTKGFPYFLSLYVGPAVLALAALGASRTRGRIALRLVLLLGAVSLLYSLGERGGLAPLVARLPGLDAFRFPSKALLGAHCAVALLAGSGADAMRTGKSGALGMIAGAWAFVLAGLCVLALWKDRWLSLLFFEAPRGDPSQFARLIAAEIGRSAVVAVLVCVVALAARHGRLPIARAQALLVIVVVLDLVRAGAGLNPQVRPSLFSLPPEIESALRVPEGGRVFSFAAQNSPELRRGLERSTQRAVLTFLLHRRALGHLTNILDRVETAWSPDVTSFGVWPAELLKEGYDPARVASILPQLRGAAIQRIVSLDPLEAAGLRLRTELGSGVGDIKLRVYELDKAWPRWSVACRVFTAQDAQTALFQAWTPEFDGAGEVALETPLQPTCQRGAVERTEAWPGRERFRVDADGAGVFVSRDSWARGWTAFVDGKPAPVLRANGRQRAVPIPEGRHHVELVYQPPGLNSALPISAFAALVCGALLFLPRTARQEPPLGVVI